MRGGRQREEDLLQKINQTGWTKANAEAFEGFFGEDIRRLVVLYCAQLGFVRLRFNPDHADQILNGRQLELWENSLSDTWIALMGGLVCKYVTKPAQKEATQEFRAYLSGVIRHTVIRNARSLKLIPRDSPGALIRALCEAKQQATRRSHMARVKFHLWDQAREAILSACPGAVFDRIYTRTNKVVDYFFEVFLLTRCSQLRQGAQVIHQLVREFTQTDLDVAVDYAGRVVPYSSEPLYRVRSRSEEEFTEEEFISMLALYTSEGGVHAT